MLTTSTIGQVAHLIEFGLIGSIEIDHEPHSGACTHHTHLRIERILVDTRGEVIVGQQVHNYRMLPLIVGKRFARHKDISAPRKRGGGKQRQPYLYYICSNSSHSQSSVCPYLSGKLLMVQPLC